MATRPERPTTSPRVQAPVSPRGASGTPRVHEPPQMLSHREDAPVFQQQPEGSMSPNSLAEKREKAAQKWVEAQKKAFLYWVNSQLGKRNESIEDLADGLSNGIHLITLVEVLTSKKVQQKWAKRAVLKAHKITNCFIALEHLRTIGEVNRLTISAENLVDGNEENLLLGFCWQLLRKFQGVPGGDSDKAGSFETGLLNWLKEMTASYNLDYSNGFKSDAFSNGTAFLALLNVCKPGTVDYNSYVSSPFTIDVRERNCNDAINLAQQHMNIPGILDAEDLAHGEASEKNIVLYLSLWYNAWKELQQGDSKESLQQKIKDLEARIKALTLENEELMKQKLALGLSTSEMSTQMQLLLAEQEKIRVERDECESKLKELREQYESLKNSMESQISQLKSQIEMSSSGAEERQAAIRSQIEEAKKERERLRQELDKLKNGLEKENEEMAKGNANLRKQLEQQKKLRETLEKNLDRSQEEQGKAINNLRKDLLQHVHDMHNWKIFLEQDKEYISEDLHIHMEAEIDDLDFEEQVMTLDSAIQEENDTLQKLHKERNKEKSGKDKKKESEKLSSQIQNRKGNRTRK